MRRFWIRIFTRESVTKYNAKSKHKKKEGKKPTHLLTTIENFLPGKWGRENTKTKIRWQVTKWR